LATLVLVSTLVAAPLRAMDVAFVSGALAQEYEEALAAFKKESITGDVLEVDLGGKSAFSQATLKRLKEDPPRVFVAVGSGGVRAVLAAGIDAPLVYAYVPDVGSLSIAKLSRSAGISVSPDPVIQAKVVAGIGVRIKRVGWIYSEPSESLRKPLEEALAARHLGLEARKVASLTEIPTATREVLDKVDILLIEPDPLFARAETIKFLSKTAIQKRKLVLSYSLRHLAAGALMVLAPDSESVGSAMALLSNRTLRGDRLPDRIAQPEKLLLKANVRGSENIGLKLNLSGAAKDGVFAIRQGTRTAPPVFSEVGGETKGPAIPPETAAASTVSSVPAVPAEVRITKETRDPRVIRKVAPVYPPLAKRQRKSGKVVVEVRVGADGSVLAVRTLKGSTMFSSAATAAVKLYRFEPALRDGIPVEGSITLTITFRR